MEDSRLLLGTLDRGDAARTWRSWRAGGATVLAAALCVAAVRSPLLGLKPLSDAALGGGGGGGVGAGGGAAAAALDSRAFLAAHTDDMVACIHETDTTAFVTENCAMALWPLPNEYYSGAKPLEVDVRLEITLSGLAAESGILQAATTRYKSLFFTHGDTGNASASALSEARRARSAAPSTRRAVPHVVFAAPLPAHDAPLPPSLTRALARALSARARR